MNQPNRYELYVLEDGEQAVKVNEDTKVPHAAIIKIVKQDHTLANMLRAQLLTNTQVLFAGYKVPHPLEPYFELRIQTDGTVSPEAALEQACTQLLATITGLKAKFETEFSYKQAEGPSGGVPAALDDPYGTGAGSAWGAGATRDYLDFGP
ncbi:DNA-directed RNA polymerase [Schizophyllum amplum]|uniref:DNA-directed RNA polymerase n=1 Tax=Schizophyllum amplum TaxID=97359 RepID=A0A550CBN4_9AGAR|nr:DNA-directed RNA polymerase [Auriculariopsis ampla]